MLSDLRTRIYDQVEASLAAGALGEDFNFDVCWSLAQDPANRAIMVWTIAITMKSSLIGEGPLLHLAQLFGPEPALVTISEAVSTGMRELRNLKTQQLSGGNGHSDKPTNLGGLISGR